MPLRWTVINTIHIYLIVLELTQTNYLSILDKYISYFICGYSGWLLSIILTYVTNAIELYSIKYFTNWLPDTPCRRKPWRRHWRKQNKKHRLVDPPCWHPVWSVKRGYPSTQLHIVQLWLWNRKEKSQWCYLVIDLLFCRA